MVDPEGDRLSHDPHHGSYEVLRHTNAIAGALLESMADALLVTDADGRIVLTNRRAAELFGYGEDELRGRPLEVLLSEHLRAAHVGHRQRLVAERRSRPMGLGLDLAGRRKDGTEVPIER